MSTPFQNTSGATIPTPDPNVTPTPTPPAGNDPGVQTPASVTPPPTQVTTQTQGVDPLLAQRMLLTEQHYGKPATQAAKTLLDSLATGQVSTSDLLDAMLALDRQTATTLVLTPVAKYSKDERFIEYFKQVRPDLFATQTSGATPPAAAKPVIPPPATATTPNIDDIADPELAALMQRIAALEATNQELLTEREGAKANALKASQEQVAREFETRQVDELENAGKLAGDQIVKQFPQISQDDRANVEELIMSRVGRNQALMQAVSQAATHAADNNFILLNSARNTIAAMTAQITNEVLTTYMKGRVGAANDTVANLRQIQGQRTPVNQGTQNTPYQPQRPAPKLNLVQRMLNNYQSRTGSQT